MVFSARAATKDAARSWRRRTCTLPRFSSTLPTDFRNRHDPSGGDFRHRSMIWRVLRESKVRAASMIVLTVGREDAPQMRLVENDHVIQTFSADRADQAFDVRILPGARRGGDDFSDAHACQAAPEDVAID